MTERNNLTTSIFILGLSSLIFLITLIILGIIKHEQRRAYRKSFLSVIIVIIEIFQIFLVIYGILLNMSHYYELGNVFGLFLGMFIPIHFIILIYGFYCLKKPKMRKMGKIKILIIIFSCIVVGALIADITISFGYINSFNPFFLIKAMQTIPILICYSIIWIWIKKEQEIDNQKTPYINNNEKNTTQ